MGTGQTCRQCGDFKAWTEYHRSPATKCGYLHYCKPCVAVRRRKGKCKECGDPAYRDLCKKCSALQASTVNASRVHATGRPALERAEAVTRAWLRAECYSAYRGFCGHCGQRLSSPGKTYCGYSCYWDHEVVPSQREGRRSINWIKATRRRRLYERDEFTCCLCGLPCVANPADGAWEPYGLSLDHIVPQAKGGGHDDDNLQTVHRMCNSMKRDLDGVDAEQLFGAQKAAA